MVLFEQKGTSGWRRTEPEVDLKRRISITLMIIKPKMFFKIRCGSINILDTFLYTKYKDVTK